jgi:apolipoprotein D and lipocalin family protein
MQTRARNTITKLTAGIGVVAAVVVFGAATASPPVQSVAQIDAQRYAGTWFELARVPNSLQARCIGDATITYKPLSDGTLRVIQRCRDADRKWFVATARAVGVDGDPAGARLKLSYLPPWLDWLPAVRGDHWVVMLDPDYGYAVISEPSREQLWILSRTPELDAPTYDRIVSRLRSARYPVDQLIPTPQQPQRQPPAFASRLRLMV